jgi:hypothetical protein
MKTPQPGAEDPRARVRYFVDEAGDPTLFSDGGHCIIGEAGCSRFFILGLLEAEDPEGLSGRLETLRRRLLADSYFRGVPSMHPEEKKTAVVFHAKDDLPEVRREVFDLLLDEPVRFFAAVRSKMAVLQYVKSRNGTDPTYRYKPNELYDYLVRTLFADRLHQHDEYAITFARRGASDRTEALRVALDQARERFAKKWDRPSNAVIKVESATPCAHGGLQAVDYCLWAIQRLYERGEDRYVQLLWPRCSLIRDIDDNRNASYGVYYQKKTPLCAASLVGHPGI